MSLSSYLDPLSERRLRPIYDQLDNGNYKKAFNEAEKVLKKQKDLIAAKVLKTIALQKMGREEEAFLLSCEVVQNMPTDENSLQGMTLYYKEIQRTELISPMYENAVKQCPNNEDYLTHLFMSYVRHDNFQQMHKVAVQLYKHHPKNPYLFWGIMSTVLQAQNAADTKLAHKMYLPLAEKMIEKHIASRKMEAEAEVRLYLLVLKLLDKHPKALEILNGELGSRLASEVRGYTPEALKIHEKLGNWDVVNIEFRKLLKKNPDVWNYALGYLDSLFHLIQLNWTPGAEDENIEQPDYKVEQALELVNQLADEEAGREVKRRGPFLLRLELAKRVTLLDLQGENQFEPTVKLLLQYARLFSSKPCCFFDLCPYLTSPPCLLTGAQADQFVAGLEEQRKELNVLPDPCDGGDQEEDARMRNERRAKQLDAHRHVFNLRISRYLGKLDSLGWNEKLSLAAEYVEFYRTANQFVERTDTDVCVADHYCVLAARLLIDVYQQTNDRSLLWRCVVILERCVSGRGGANYEAKFLLVRIYTKLAVFLPCAELYDSMDIKHVQQDTLGCVMYRYVTALGHYMMASQVFQMSRMYFSANRKECVECLIACFRNGTFDKISEMIEYRKAVDNSYHGAMTATEQPLMNLFAHWNIDQPIEELLPTFEPSARIDFDSLRDHRDFTVISDVNSPDNRLSAEMIERSFRHEKNWLRFRELLLRAIFIVTSDARRKPNNHRVNGHVANGNGTDDQANADLAETVDELESLRVKVGEGDEGEYPFHGPIVTRLPLCIEAHYIDNIKLVLKCCSEVLNHQSSSSSTENSSQKDDAPVFSLHTDLSAVLNNIKDFLATCNSGLTFASDVIDNSSVTMTSSTQSSLMTEPIPEPLLRIRPHVMERITLCTEMYSVCVLLLTSLQPVVAEAKSQLNRRKRKKTKSKQQIHEQDKETVPEFIKNYQESVRGFHELGKRISEAIASIQSDADVLPSILKKLTLAGAESSDDSSASSSPKSRRKSKSRRSRTSSSSSSVTSAHVSELAQTREIMKKVVRSSTSSCVTSTKQLSAVVDGRLKNLSKAKV